MGLGDLTPGAQIGIGIVVGLLSTSVQSVGLTLQRKSHLLEDDRPDHVAKRPPHRRRRWQIGMLLFIVSNILGSSIQITTLPLVILSPLQASGLVFNSICATLILAEPFTRYSLVGTILVCVGASLIAAFGALKEPAHSLDELLYLLGRRPFLVWMGGTALMVGIILGGTKASKIMFPRQSHTAKFKMARGIAYGCASGILSAHCLLVAKSAVELLVRTVVDRVNQFNRWQSWIILLGLVSLALTQLFYLHRGLKLCSTSVLYPLVFCVYNIIAILDGLIYYQQASRLPTMHAGLIALGTAILLSGVLALSWRLHDDTIPPAKSKAAGALTPGLGVEESLLASPDDDNDITSSTNISSSPVRRKTDNDKILSIARRRQALSEAEEIWGELQDEDAIRASLRSTGVRSATILEEGTDGSGGRPTERTSLLSKAPGRRKSGPSRRVTSYGFPKVTSARSLSRQRSLAQGATGGWWKMRWWKRPHREGSDMA